MRLGAVGKRYGRGTPWILRDAELAVGAGELVRIEGPNGSGKSTLLRLVAGIERADTGDVVVDGRRAYVPERFPPALPFHAHGYLRHLGRIHGLRKDEADRRAGYWLERFGIAGRSGTPIAHLSKGTCQKVAVAQALLAEADVLLLDEAWTGLDRVARAELDTAVAERAAGGGQVLFVDHDPNRLAGMTTAAYAVVDGALRAAELAEQGPAGPLVRIEAEGPVPEWLPGAPARKPLADGATLLEVDARHSDALLRRLLTIDPPAHIRAVGESDGGPGPVWSAAEAPGAASFDPGPASPAGVAAAGSRAPLGALVAYYVELLLRSQRWLPPVLAYVLLLVVGMSAGEEAFGALAFSGAVLVPVAAWLVRCTVTAEPAAARSCVVAAAGPVRTHLGALLAALLVSSALGALGLAAVLLMSGDARSDKAWTAPAGLLVTAVCVLTGAAVGTLFNRPVVLGAQYGIPLGLAAATLALVTTGTPANLVLRALIGASRREGLHLPVLALPEALLVAGAALAAAALLVGRRQE
ncbi:ATP-binding cassette domain-containing protein [Kitasatospora sp. NPDC048365]|uniref:ABC transporter ATP-binding protein n=1 Tax=Kitasatospora sp. NPDC048365 TaxID=3364050 RepID=UPI0037223A3E